MLEMRELLRIQSIQCRYAMTLEKGEPMAAPCNCFLLKQKMQLVIVNSRSLMNFSVGIMQTLVKLLQVEILELITCSATGTGMPVKRMITSNETKVFSSGFIERCLIFMMKSVLSSTKDEVLPQ